MSRLGSALVFLALLATPALAQTPPTLALSDRQATKTFTQAELWQRATQTVTVRDELYGKSMTYRVIPLAAFLKDAKIEAGDYLEARATDGFLYSIPTRLLDPSLASQVEAFLAVEDPADKWQILPDSLDKATAGPFYIVWKRTPPAYLSHEVWAAQLAGIKVIDSPLKKWPGLELPASVPPADRIRAGLDRHVALCLTCHQVNGVGGAGAAVGPDFNRPRNALDVMDASAMKLFVRNPKSKHPDSKMPRFDQSQLSTGDLDAIIAWLEFVGRQPR
jgi:mono/diheme cytochrome c family protein